jgi:methionyl-tRNA formyltransferase
MRINVLGDTDTPAYYACSELVLARGHLITRKEPVLAIAPLLTQILSVEDIRLPDLGTLIFHPSPLPYGRGASAIKYAYMRKEPITAATWFWADSGIDSGDICEQEILRIDYTRRPREFYEKYVIPAMVRTLERVLDGIERGYVRRVPQQHEHATYDRRL